VKADFVVSDADRSLYEEHFISNYIAQRHEGLDQQEANRRAVLALLATGHQPSQFLLRLIRGELTHYWSAEPIARKHTHRRRQALAIRHEIAILTQRLKRQGIANPITQARNKAAKRWGFASGESLNKWLRRNR